MAKQTNGQDIDGLARKLARALRNEFLRQARERFETNLSMALDEDFEANDDPEGLELADEEMSAPRRNGKVKRGPKTKVEGSDTKIVSFLRKHPDSDASTVADHIGVDRVTTSRWLKRLIEHREVKKRGQRRGTTYSAR